MLVVTNAEVLTRSRTGYERPRHSAEAVLAVLHERRHASSMLAHLGSFSSTGTGSDVWSSTDTLIDGSYVLRTHIDTDHSASLCWFGDAAASDPRATTSSATTVSSLRHLLKRRLRDERLRRLTPERRRLYDNIRRLRGDLESVDFDIVEELRELREDG